MDWSLPPAAPGWTWDLTDGFAILRVADGSCCGHPQPWLDLIARAALPLFLHSIPSVINDVQ